MNRIVLLPLSLLAGACDDASLIRCVDRSGQPEECECGGGAVTADPGTPCTADDELYQGHPDSCSVICSGSEIQDPPAEA